MSFFQWYMFTFLVLFTGLGRASSGRSYWRAPPTYPTIVVDPSGNGNFSTIQSAIDSVPSNNGKWICIYVKTGTYNEQVKIPFDKPMIYLKGDGKRKTNVIWSSVDSIAQSATFISEADNIIVKSITFTNSYNFPPGTSSNPVKPAVAAMIAGDRSAFYRCGFLGFQDTLWDVQGRHYFKLCTIQGAVDFIMGAGQSIYERCTVSVIAGSFNGLAGFITAQARSNPDDPNGFVFKDCNVIGNGTAFLGRPWRDYARVLFYNSSLSDVVVPQGWNAWGSAGREYDLTYAEDDCRGLGSDTSKRVEWESKLSQDDVQRLTSMSFIDNEGWIRRQVFNMLPSPPAVVSLS